MPENELDFVDQELLITVPNDNEGNNVVALLDSCGIPAYCKHDGVGGYLKVFMGSVSIGGVDVYVRKDQLPQALEALEADGMLGEGAPLSDDYSGQDSAPKNTDSKPIPESRRRKLFRYILLAGVAVFGVFSLLQLIAAIYALIATLF